MNIQFNYTVYKRIFPLITQYTNACSPYLESVCNGRYERIPYHFHVKSIYASIKFLFNNVPLPLLMIAKGVIINIASNELLPLSIIKQEKCYLPPPE